MAIEKAAAVIEEAKVEQAGLHEDYKENGVSSNRQLCWVNFWVWFSYSERFQNDFRFAKETPAAWDAGC